MRSLLHDYPLVAWTQAGAYRSNATVVDELQRGQPEADGSLVYTVKLKAGLKYSDGSPLNARDYVFSILLFSSPQLRALTSLNADYGHIQGFEAFSSGASERFSGVRLVDDLSFSIRIKPEYLPYFYELSYINATPFPMAVLAPECDIADEGEGAGFVGDLTADKLRATILDPTSGYLSYPRVTSGPYRLVDYDATSHRAEFEINPHYLGNYEGQRPSIPRLVFQETRNQTMLEQLATGQVDLVNKVTDGEVINEALPQAGSMFPLIMIQNEEDLSGPNRPERA